jgi:hypothetical protein
MKALCEAPPAARSGRRLRAATEAEWKVIDGIAEGRIVCRRVPDFMSSVLDAKERIRFHSTIQKQVEGELIMHIRGRGRIKESR